MLNSFLQRAKKAQSRNASIILLDAAKLLRRHNWTQGANYTEIDGQKYFCALGAIGSCGMGSSAQTFSLVGDKTVAALNARGFSDLTLVEWNDTVAKNVDEVVEFLEEAAEI